jgi:hypothetical protein
MTTDAPSLTVSNAKFEQLPQIVDMIPTPAVQDSTLVADSGALDLQIAGALPVFGQFYENNTLLFKMGVFDRTYIGKNIAGVSIGSTALNRMYLNEGSPSLSYPLRIHVTLDRPKFDALLCPRQFVIHLRADELVLAKINVDVDKQTIVGQDSTFITNPKDRESNLFLGNSFYFPPNEAKLQSRKFSLINQKDIHAQFCWPFRNKKEVNAWLEDIVALNSEADVEKAKMIPKTGLWISLTGSDEELHFAYRIIPFSKSAYPDRRRKTLLTEKDIEQPLEVGEAV